MAYQTPLASPVIQMVKRVQGKEKDFYTSGIKKLIHDHCSNDYNVPYTVVSIIGAQSSGKSTLMNTMFKTEFQMLNQETQGRRATTEGIWAAVCKGPNAIVLDIEGADGQEHQDDAGFENQAALFALSISDVIFFNINVQDIGRMHGASIPLLRTIFQERLNHNMHRTEVVIAVRDYNHKASESFLRQQLLSQLKTIFDESTNKEKMSTKYYDTSVEFFPHFDYDERAFQKKCQDIIAQPGFLKKRQQNWPVDEFPNLAEELWKRILQNEKLNMPSYWVLLSRERCEAVMNKKLLSLQANDHYKSFTEGSLTISPIDFEAAVKRILQTILHEYSDATKYCDEGHANKMEDNLRTQIIRDAAPGFMRALDNLVYVFLTNAQEEIEKCMKRNLFEDMDGVVTKQSMNFRHQIQGLELYDDIARECLQEVEQNLRVLTRQIRNSCVMNFVGRYAKKFLVMAGHLISIGVTLGGAIVQLGI
ncbi:protein ROOT HAIR DEFECTIVE 3-like isoform X2 [Miscanthus floridulus]|uniref:protein ROOT HAIR DEFECTIVE 3-like isoform X2 n=1 Tax=Miscanthus floridulus TaxID=154761 RepID=UPI003459B6E5